MPEIEEVVAVAVNGKHPGMRMILRSKLLAEFSDRQGLASYINAGVIEKQLIHHLLRHQVMHIRGSFHQQAVNSKALKNIQRHLGIRCLVAGTCHQNHISIVFNPGNHFIRNIFNT